MTRVTYSPFLIHKIISNFFPSGEVASLLELKQEKANRYGARCELYYAELATVIVVIDRRLDAVTRSSRVETERNGTLSPLRT